MCRRYRLRTRGATTIMELTRSLYVMRSLLDIRQYVVFNVKVSYLVIYTIIFLVSNNGTRGHYMSQSKGPNRMKDYTLCLIIIVHCICSTV